MGNGLDVFAHAVSEENVLHARSVLERKLDPKLIKERQQGATKLSYIGGHTVIRLLNEAFGYKWSFEIVSDEIVPSQPKLNKYAKAGENKYDDQPPVVKVLGRLTIPGLGVKEQYGSKVLIGGASEQEASFKSASTDALKKCATLFGIGLELYEDDEVPSEGQAASPTTSTPPKQAYNASSSQASSKQTYTNTAKNASSAPKPATQPTKPTDGPFPQEDIEKMKEMKAILGITENTQFDAYVREFLDNKDATMVRNITPSNVKAFIVYLSKKVENV